LIGGAGVLPTKH